MAGTSNSGRGGTEERILATAASLFARSGYNGVSTRDIAAAAEINEVTIYRHYPRKRDLYLAVLETELRRVQLRGDLLARIAEARDGQAVLVRTFELISTTLMHNPDLLRLIQYSALELSDDLDVLLHRHLSELVEVVASYIQPWIKSGDLQCTSSKALVLTLVAILFSSNSFQRFFSPDMSSKESMLEAYAGLCRGVGASPL